MNVSTTRTPPRKVIGMVLLEADHAVETLDQADPFCWTPPAGLTRGFFGNPTSWPAPVVFAVAKSATASAAAAGTPAATRGVVEAVTRLDGRCDLIVGECGYFARAWDAFANPPSTPTVLSGLDLLDEALRCTSRDIAVFFYEREAGERYLASRAGTDRVRAIGITPAGDWPLIGRPDWATEPAWSIEGIERGLRDVIEAETGPGGRLVGIGAIVIECTIIPQFRDVIRQFTSVPVFDVAATVHSLLG
jgi:hypothetical protein